MTDQALTLRLEKTRAALTAIRNTLDNAIDQIKAWQTSPALPPSEVELQQHRELLVMAYARYRILQDEYDALLGLNTRLIKQHQSAKDAFRAGWDAYRIEIEAHAVGEDYIVLRRLLDALDTDNVQPF